MKYIEYDFLKIFKKKSLSSKNDTEKNYGHRARDKAKMSETKFIRSKQLNSLIFWAGLMWTTVAGGKK